MRQFREPEHVTVTVSWKYHINCDRCATGDEGKRSWLTFSSLASFYFIDQRFDSKLQDTLNFWEAASSFQVSTSSCYYFVPFGSDATASTGRMDLNRSQHSVSGFPCNLKCRLHEQRKSELIRESTGLVFDRRSRAWPDEWKADCGG